MDQAEMALIGGDDIQIERENDDHDDDLIDDGDHGNDQDTTGTAQVTEELPEPLQEALDQPSSTSGWNRIKSRNSSAQKARTQFQQRTSSADWRTLPRQTGGWMHKPTTILPTHSVIPLKNGSRQWSTGTTMSTINPCGQTSRRFSNRSTPFTK
jgi:hypothetical protein